VYSKIDSEFISYWTEYINEYKRYIFPSEAGKIMGWDSINKDLISINEKSIEEYIEYTIRNDIDILSKDTGYIDFSPVWSKINK